MSNRIRATTLIGLAALFACRPSEPPQSQPPPPAPQPAPVEPEPVRGLMLGMILPETASSDLAEYAVLIREGVDLALSEYRSAGGPAIELIVRDDGGNALGASRAMESFEAEGAIAVIGPLMSEGLNAASSSRTTRDLVLLSPTASETPGPVPNVYSLNMMDTRGAAALIQWCLQSGLQRVAIMYATTTEDAASARAFAQAARDNGAEVVAELPFDPGTTTFSQPVNRLVQSRAQAVFVAASERDIQQLAPQFAYYGLSGVQILGTEAWVHPGVLRAVPASILEGVIVATPLPIGSGATRWSEFVQLYETTYRRTLDNPYPALGYDAAKLILDLIADGKARPRDLATAFNGVRAFRGATGVLSVENGVVSRQPFLVRIRSGRPETLPSGGRE